MRKTTLFLLTALVGVSTMFMGCATLFKAPQVPADAFLSSDHSEFVGVKYVSARFTYEVKSFGTVGSIALDIAVEVDPETGKVITCEAYQKDSSTGLYKWTTFSNASLTGTISNVESANTYNEAKKSIRELY